MSQRLNQYLANATGLSRRAADQAIADGRVLVNGTIAKLGTQVDEHDDVLFDGSPATSQEFTYLVMNKPVGYICSRAEQGNAPTIYDLLPEELHHLKSVGRLDKDSSGILLLTNDGVLANQLMHPSGEKEKLYLVALDKPLQTKDQEHIEAGVALEDGPSKLGLAPKGGEWLVSMHEGRNRQIRRTFAELGYLVTKLNRLSFGKLNLGDLAPGKYETVTKEQVV